MTIQINGTSGISGVDGSAATPALQGSDTNTGISFGTDEVNINTGGTTRATVDSSGRLLVGTSTARSNVYVGGTNLVPNVQFESVGNNYNAGLSLINYSALGYSPLLTLGLSLSDTAGTNAAVSANLLYGIINFVGNDGTNFRTGASVVAACDGAVSTGDLPTRLVFSTTADGASSPTERMRISNVGRTSITSVENTYRSLEVSNTNNTSGNGTYLSSLGSNCNNTSSYHFVGSTGGPDKIHIYGNGNVVNSNNSYGSLSDAKLKENIVDANSQWDDLKALQVRNYNFKEGQTHTQIGLIAQEVELVSPGLVTESPDRDEEGNDLGTVTKSVNYSVLYMKAVKALQEAMERIETLETQNAEQAITIASFEARISALEGGN